MPEQLNTQAFRQSVIQPLPFHSNLPPHLILNVFVFFFVKQPAFLRVQCNTWCFAIWWEHTAISWLEYVLSYSWIEIGALSGTSGCRHIMLFSPWRLFCPLLFSCLTRCFYLVVCLCEAACERERPSLQHSPTHYTECPNVHFQNPGAFFHSLNYNTQQAHFTVGGLLLSVWVP